MEDFALLGIVVIVVIVLFAIFRSMRSHQGGSTQSTSTSQASAAKAQIAQDMKSMQTSRIVDAVSILEELGSTSPNYRQYTELVGTTQSTSSVTAPYSKRQVAYYDLRCFKVENIGGQETETLIAHEKSIEPFCFNDGSSEQPVYVDLASFGNNVILVNSANRIEGPGSDFAKALDASANGTSSGTANAYAIVGQLRDWAERMRRTLRGFAPQPAYAFAGIDGLSMSDFETYAKSGAKMHAPSNIAFAGHGPGGRHPGGGPRPGGGGMGGGMGGFDFGSFGNLDSFLGGAGNLGNIGGPRGDYWRGNSSSDAGEMLLGMGLGALLGSLAASSTSGQNVPVTPQSQFRGYRIVEDVVPLNYQVYALGEIYKNGQHVTIGKSTSSSYPSSFFATKPEAEVISHLNGK